MLHTDPQETLLREAVRPLVEALAPVRIYLFGSRARGDEAAESDYDLMAIVSQPVPHPYEPAQQALAALWEVSLRADILANGTGSIRTHESCGGVIADDGPA